MFGNPLLLADEGYQISRSVRLRSSASAYFNRTPASAGNRRTWTWSGWVKRGSLGTQQYIFFAGSGSNDRTGIRWNNDNLEFESQAGGVTQIQLTTSAVYRDASAWYHIVYLLDTTQATAANRAKIYVNGAEVTAFSTATYPSLNADLYPNSTNAHVLGRYNPGPSNYFDGYLTEVNFIDGQALTPSSFGETDAVTGVWKPKKYTGTYGTNGFYLNFSDNSNNTATTIGKDYSGNGNNWTPNNISVTSGATYDSMLDVPTLWADGGNGRGNYCTLNPLYTGAMTLTAGNLNGQSTVAAYRSSVGTIAFPTSGKWYFEFEIVSNNGSGNNESGGIINIANTSQKFYIDCFATSATSIRKNVDGTSSGAYGTAANGMVFGVAVDADNGKAYLAVANTWIDSSSPTGGTGGYSMATGATYAPFAESYNSGVTAFNFGQRPFAYTPPTGFKALHTGNLPEPVIKKGNAWFDATTYTGTGANQSIVNSGSMQPDLVWLKTRNTVSSNLLYDSSRGVLNYLSSNQTAAEASLANSLTAFNSNGFSLGSDGNVNGNGTTFVGWQWKEGATQGFDIVTYTGDSAASRSISHSLGVAPKMIIAKIRSTANGWPVWHTSLGATGYLILNQTQAASTNSAIWNSAPTSTTFAVGNNGLVNASGETYVAYLFAEVAGFSKFGSYTGNGSADGPFVFCGFRPRYVLIKQSDAATNWIVMDSARSPTNTIPDFLLPNESNAESTSSASNIDFTSNGFKIRNSNSDRNTNGSTYIFAAFAETPFRYALAR